MVVSKTTTAAARVGREPSSTPLHRRPSAIALVGIGGVMGTAA